MVTKAVLCFVIAAVSFRNVAARSQLVTNISKVTWDVGTLQWAEEEYGAAALENGSFSPEDTVVWNADIWHGRVFLCLPRWSKGVSATLVSAKWSSRASSSPPTLHPFPNWSMQIPGGDCSGFQSVTAAISDNVGRLWVLDAGNADLGCPPKFILFELILGGYSGLELSRHVVRIPGVSGKDLRWMAVDWGAAVLGPGPRAYASDPGGGAILVYSMRESACWKVLSGVRNGIGDVTISRFDSLLYFTPRKDSEKLYGIDLKVLRDPPPILNSSRAAPVNLVGNLLGPSSGLAADHRGGLLYFLKADHAVLRWDSTGPLLAEWHQVLHQDAEALPNVPRVIFDSQRSGWALANGFPKNSSVSATCLKVYKSTR